MKNFKKYVKVKNMAKLTITMNQQIKCSFYNLNKILQLIPANVVI